MLLTTHEELLQHIGETVIFSHTNGKRAFEEVGMLFLDRHRQSDYQSIYLLSNALSGRLPLSDEWKDYGYKYSWIISHTLKHYEEDNQDVVEIRIIQIDFNKLEEVLC